MHIINLTPHTLNIIGVDGNEIIIAPHKDTAGNQIIARLDESREDAGTVNGIAVTRPVYGQPYLLVGDERREFPQPEEGKIYVVSGMMLPHFVGRTDVFAPGKGVRNADGRIVATEGFSAPPQTRFIDRLKAEIRSGTGYGQLIPDGEEDDEFEDELQKIYLSLYGNVKGERIIKELIGFGLFDEETGRRDITNIPDDFEIVWVEDARSGSLKMMSRREGAGWLIIWGVPGMWSQVILVDDTTYSEMLNNLAL